MEDDARIEKLITSLERLVEAEQSRRNERDQQRRALLESRASDPGELEKSIPKFDVNELEEKFNKQRETAERRLRDSLERERLLLSNLSRQTELLEEIVAKLEARR